MRFSLRVCTAFALIAFVAGCSGDAGPKKASITGKLLDGANPYTLDTAKLKLPPGTSLPPGARPLQVTFLPIEKGETVPANVDAAAGTFTATLAPGKYKVAIVASAGPGTPDLFGGKYSPERTQIQREIVDGQEVVIDLKNPGG